MIRTSTQRSSVNASRVRDAFYQTLAHNTQRQAQAYNPELELSPAETQQIHASMLSLSENRIAQILAAAAHA